MEEPAGSRLRPPHRPPKSHSCPTLLTDGAVTSQHEREAFRPLTAGGEEPLGPIALSLEDEVTFDDIAVVFSEEEWAVLEDGQKDLYRRVMLDNYLSLISLGVLLDKPELISRIEKREAELLDKRAAFWSFRHRGEEELCFPGTIQSLAADTETSRSAGAGCDRSSHLGALMRLVNQIPGFLLGGSSPVQSLEESGTFRPCSEVKTEEGSPASSCSQRIREPPVMCWVGPVVRRGPEKSLLPGNAKLEEAEVSINPPSSSTIRLKRDPDCRCDPPPLLLLPPGGLKIKREECAVTPPGSLSRRPSEISIKSRSPLTSRNPATREHRSTERPPHLGGDGGHWTSLPAPPSTGTSSRNTSLSPASVSDGVSSVGAKDLHIKIKEEDSGSERDPAESPLCGRKVFSSPLTPSCSSLIMEQLRHGSPADNIPQGNSHLHSLVNCLKEISAGRRRAHQGPSSATRWGAEGTTIPADSSIRAARLVGSRGPEMPTAQPNPFTVAVTNGSSRLKGMEVKMADTWRLRDNPHPGSSSVGKYLDKFPTRMSGEPHVGSSNLIKSEEPQRLELGVKRTHSDDLSRLCATRSAAKRPALESGSPSRGAGWSSSRPHDTWKPPEEKPRAPDDDQPNGKSPLLNVMNCVRKIPGCHSGPPGRGPASRSAAPITQGAEGKVKVEKDEIPPVAAASQWIQPPLSPNSPDQSGPSSTNVHLSRLMRLMEEIPVVESSSSSRTMYSIAIGHSVARRADRGTYLSCYNDDGTFQADLDNTIASVDSTYSDDTSWSSDNVDPSYSAIDGLQKVVSEFADVASVSPLVAVAAPSAIPEGPEPKTRDPVTGCSSHVHDHAKGSQRGTPVSTVSPCSAENGNASYAALCGLQKVVCGFKEQACVSPFSAVRGTPQHSLGLQGSPARKSFPAVEEESPYLQGSSPSPGSRFLLEGPWLSRMDPSYSALSDLQKVVNGFSDLGCISPFSAVSTATSEGTVETSSQRKSEPLAGGSALTGLCARDSLSPVTKTQNPAGKPEPTVRRAERAQSEAPPSQGSHQISHKARPASSSHCIDLTLEEEPAGPIPRVPGQSKARGSHELRRGRTPELPSGRTVKPPGGRTRPPPASRQLIDLTEEEDGPARPRAPSAETARGSSHAVSGLSGTPHHPLTADRRLRPPLTAARLKRVGMERPLDPGPPRAPRGGIPAVNQHISSLEKLLKGVPTFPPPSNPSGPQPGGSWWFKSTSPHET